jgi:hypothetical protein
VVREPFARSRCSVKRPGRLMTTVFRSAITGPPNAAARRWLSMATRPLRSLNG